jgi:hypothetical protein
VTKAKGPEFAAAMTRRVQAILARA